MEIPNIFLITSVGAVICGWIFDVLGLWLSVKMAEKNKVKRSKFFYVVMRIGEIVEKIAFNLFLMTAFLFVARYLMNL
ncbi:hypothetical protein UT300003_32010 [Clostridium sardiniense]